MLGAVPTVLTLVVIFSSHNVEAMPQFVSFPGETSERECSPQLIIKRVSRPAYLMSDIRQMLMRKTGGVCVCD